MIRRIEAYNYRALRSVSQSLDRFHVLVGANASGKSTFLDVIALLGDFVRYGADRTLLLDVEQEQGRARRMEELFFNHQGRSFQLAVELAVPQHLARLGRPDDSPPVTLARYEVELGRGETEGLEILAETLWLLEKRESSKPEVPEMGDLFPREVFQVRSLMTKGTRPGWRTVVKKVADSGNDYYRAETSKWNIQFRGGRRKAALGNLPQDAARFPIAIWVRDMLLEGVGVLVLDSAAMRRPVGPSVSRSYDVKGANLPLVIQDLKQQYPVNYADWIAHVRTILPDLERIEVYEREEDRHVYLAVKYTSAEESVPSWLVSDGTLRLLALTLTAYLQDQRIYLIEEPENGLFPKAIEGVFNSLSSVYRGQVLVATHSPLLMGLAEPAQLLCFSKSSSGAVDIVTGSRHPALRDWKGEVDLSVLYAAGVLG